MPGMSFICDLKGDLTQKKSAILQSLDSMIHTDQYDREILLDEECYLLACTRYKEYPTAFFESDDLSLYFEGRIYGKDSPAISKELTDLAEHMFQPQPGGTEQIAEWLLNTDGDFIVFVLHKKLNAIGIMNDALSRLPLYYSSANGQLIISRELRFIANIIDGRKFDRMAIAQYLLFGFSLGKKTLLENVYRLEPATLIRINPDKAEIRIDNLHHLSFETKKYGDRTIQQNGSELASLFCKACENRGSKTGKNILSVSGGLDSRAVAACLHRNKIPFVGLTFLDHTKSVYSSDAIIAERIANAFGVEWRLIQLAAPRGKDLMKLLRIQNGLNYLGMSFILPYFDNAKQTYGSGITFFTGDGGDQILQRDWRPSRKPKSLDELVKYIISTRQLFPLDTVSRLTGIKRHEIIDELKSHLMSYPENEWTQKYVHFVICEVGFNWYFPGEDRNRCYFWSVTPFYSVHFFDYVMNCPDRQKSQYALYRCFLSELSPQAAAIEYAGPQVPIPLPITSIRFRIMHSMIAILSRFPNLKREVIRVIKPVTTSSYQDHSTIINCLREQMINCKTISDYLSSSPMQAILTNCSMHTKLQIDNLFTITSCIEELECGSSTIEKYLGSEFA